MSWRPGMRMGLAAALAAAVLAGSLGCSSDDPPKAAAEPSTNDESATEPLSPAGQAFAVGRRQLSLLDESRTTDAGPNGGRQVVDSRTLPVTVLYPTEGDPAAPTGTDVPIAAGSFPLVVFSHGLFGSADLYAGFVEPLVRHGYVVALPTFPLTSGPSPVQDDYVNQPGDVSFVIDEIFGMSNDAASWLAGHVDRTHVAAAGHSMGAVTTFGVGFNDCCVDDRIDAVISVSGIALDYPAGKYTWPETPLLLVHGAKDQVVPVSGSDSAFDAAKGPTWYLRFPEVDHYGVGLGDDGVLTNQAAAAFLDSLFRDSPQALEDMAGVVAESGRAEWRTNHLP